MSRTVSQMPTLLHSSRVDTYIYKTIAWRTYRAVQKLLTVAVLLLGFARGWGYQIVLVTVVILYYFEIAHMVDVMLTIYLRLNFSNSKFNVAHKAMMRSFTTVSSYTYIYRYRREDPLGIVTPISFLLNDRENNPSMPQHELNKRNGGQHVFYHLICLCPHLCCVRIPQSLPFILSHWNSSSLLYAQRRNQLDTVRAALTNRFTIIRGAATTGKSFTFGLIMRWQGRIQDPK